MNTFEIIILALALVFNSWISYLNAGLVLAGGAFVRKFLYTGITFLVQFILAGVGIWVGYKVGSPELKVNMLISLSILFILGLKVLLSGIRQQAPEKVFDYNVTKVVFFAALAEGITPLIIGIAIGLLSIDPYLNWLLIGVFLIFGILAGQIIPVQMGIRSLKLRLGPVGGFLLLAAALKLILNLSGF